MAPSPLHIAACRHLIDLVWSWDHMAMFHYPVKAEDVPTYKDVIENPIDLSTMRSKLEKAMELRRRRKEDEGKNDEEEKGSVDATAGASPALLLSADSLYTCDTDLVNDLDLMITNALTFNATGTVWHSHAKKLRKALTADLIPQTINFSKTSAAVDDADETPDGFAIDEEELVYVDQGSKKESHDYSKSMRKEEKKKSEDISSVLSGMQADLEIPIEELRKRFAMKAASSEDAKKKKASKRAREEDGSSSSSSSSSSGYDSDSSSDDEEDDSSEEGEENSESDDS